MAKPTSPASRKPRPSSGPYAGDESGLVVMGRVVAAHGIRGWIRLKAFTEQPEGLARFPRWVVRAPEGWREMPLEEFALRPNGTAAKLEGCDDRTAAERLKGAQIAVPRAELEPEAHGSIYQVDLVGLEVVEEGGERLGRVASFFEAGGASVMVVEGQRERMIPFVPEFVKAVDREAGRITVDWKADYDA